MRYIPNAIQMQGLSVKLQTAITNEFIDESIKMFKVSEAHSIYTAVIETEHWRNTIEFDGETNKVKQRDIEPLGKCVNFYVVLERMSSYFGLDSLSDKLWFYGFYVLSTLLFAASVFIAYVL